jgi:ABC-type transporter Mla maintaining outer membrane lipid asymmetry ATPase subunit MlaF
VLAQVAFDAPPGSVVIVQGSTGDDQTTLLSLLLGLQPLDSGTVTLDGVDVANLPLAETRRRIAVVLAEPWLLDGTIADNIQFGRPDLSPERVMIAARLAGLDTSTCGAPGLDTEVGPDGDRLALGARRQVALARALATDPSVLLLEEPMSGLDARARTALIRALDRAAEGRTTIVATRRPETVPRADAGYRIVNGRLLPNPAVVPGTGDEPDPGAAPDPGVEPSSLIDGSWWAGDGRVDTPAPAASSPSVADRDRCRAHHHRHDGARSASIGVGDEIAPGYRAAGLLDRGAHTETWLAWSRRLADAVTVRLPRRRPVTYTALEEISREFTIACGLAHPAIATALDADLETELPYVVHERVAGRTLASSIANDGPLTTGEVLSVAYDLTHALDHLHRRGYAHLDLRPENVIRSGPRGSVISDFRHSLPLGEQRVRFIERHRHGLVAPELLRGAPAEPAMDIHALGIVLHQATTGALVERHDPESDQLLMIDQRGDRRRRPVTDLAPRTDRAVADLIEWLLADRPSDRPSAAQVLARIRPLLLDAVDHQQRAA